MKMGFEQFQDIRVQDSQANSNATLYKCTDGVMRTAYDRLDFEKRVRWTWFGWNITEALK